MALGFTVLCANPVALLEVRSTIHETSHAGELQAASATAAFDAAHGEVLAAADSTRSGVLGLHGLPASVVKALQHPNVDSKVKAALEGLPAEVRSQLNVHRGVLTASPAPGITMALSSALDWMRKQPAQSIHAVVTDPPYSLEEFNEQNLAKLKAGRGGVWRKPPVFDGVERRPLPRFTVLGAEQRKMLHKFYRQFAREAHRILLPGGHLVIAANPLLSTLVYSAFDIPGLEKRGELIRIVKTMRGGDRPKGAEQEFSDVSVMPRASWEPWGLFRKELSEKTVAANLRRWGTGGFRRISEHEPFRDLFECAPARGVERAIADHPSLKPQRLMRYIVAGVLPVGEGIIYDPFFGSGSTLGAAANLGVMAIGTEREPDYFFQGVQAIPLFAQLALPKD